jgi:large subunit ribosomal protein L29
MKALKASDLRNKSDQELADELKETIKNLFHMRCQSATEKLETPSQMKKSRRDIARIKTLQRERELAAARIPVGQEKK